MPIAVSPEDARRRHLHVRVVPRGGVNRLGQDFNYMHTQFRLRDGARFYTKTSIAFLCCLFFRVSRRW